MKASIVIANYNNAQFIDDCISSLKSQTYKDIEIIFFDDNSKDNSIEVIKKFEDIKIIKNKQQTNFGSLNQINAFKKAIELSTGEIIFFLDSDDYFALNKVEKIINEFSKDDKKMIIYDFPILFKDKKQIIYEKRNKILKTYWGYIHPTSCISIKKSFTNEIFRNVSSEDYTNIWLDLRILLFSKYMHSYNVINEKLTYYRQTEDNISSKFKKYSSNWWIRRNEAHEYFFDFAKKNNLKISKNLDFYITKIFNSFIK